ncbi:hypothetical protein D9758_018940 [Tetrapyrgos nigripes]|uniref:Uncharacterized protein n=1 Tax=Tetrapyrgos nigripes TaxID=182062 RepID=A0A8H5AT99_9AGAR|nr:hypothetical protein D9758_018940 [Tetrapyrgos nigripes]
MSKPAGLPSPAIYGIQTTFFKVYKGIKHCRGHSKHMEAGYILFFGTSILPEPLAPNVLEHEGVLYTRDQGAVAIRIHQITCEGCRVVYHHDYYIVNDPDLGLRMRVYYDMDVAYSGRALPEVIQVATHHFIEVSVALAWRYSMLFSWTSASGCAEAYKACDTYGNVPLSWPISPSLRTEYIYDAFKVISLLEFHHSHSLCLRVPQTINQAERFNNAMLSMNEYINVQGQLEVNHRCEKCVRCWINETGNEQEIFAVPLSTTKVTFCTTHFAEENRCRVNGCTALVTQGSKTCSNLEHKAAERKYKEAGQSIFQLKRRSERAHQRYGVSDSGWNEGEDMDSGNGMRRRARQRYGVSDSGWNEGEDMDSGNGIEVEIIQEGQKSKVRGWFGRKRTHNEQLIIAPCGIILARETFYHSEAFSLVAAFCKNTFQSQHKPDHFIYDTNCILSKYVRNPGNSEMCAFFKDIKLAVDVFHFKSKHKEEDEYCGQNCNPVDFPELLYVDQNGKLKWYFNTSIAEQTNTWFGRYQPLCREMGCIFYEFFLNQMIMMYNVEKRKQLERDGYRPSYW